jgi:hypothetical protein
VTLELTEASEPIASVTELREQLLASEEHNELLQESLADLELAAEDRGWRRLGFEMEMEFSREGFTQVVRNCRVMAIASPLVKRGLQLRIGYIWGQGVEVQARAGEQAEQDVNAVVQAFWDDPSNQTAFTSSQAQEENERTLGTDGNLCLAFFTNPLTGRVQVRVTPFEEIVDKIANPQDRDEPWFFLRQYQGTVVKPFRTAAGDMTTRSREATIKVIHPALGYRPVSRPTSIDGIPVLWDQPILHIPVNRPNAGKWGIPDAYASLPWARAYEGFLTDWARLVKALSKFAWRLTGDKQTKASKAVQKLRTAMPRPGSQAPGQDSTAGQVAAMGPGQQLEAIPKTGATIDSESGKPLAAMVAAALGIPVTLLLADPGTTGARAVAETLDKPTILEMGMRRELWRSVIETVTSYVIDQAVKAPRGPLKGTVIRDRATGQEVITLAGEVERTVEVTFPPLNELDPIKLVAALVDADSTGKLPDVWMVKALLKALGERDIDEVIAPFLDADGNWTLDAGSSAGQSAVNRFRRGEDPTEGLS